MHLQPPVQHATATYITTTGLAGNSVTTHMSITDPYMGDVGLCHILLGWAGCDFNFLPEESEPSGDDVPPGPWGGSWNVLVVWAFYRIALRGPRIPVVALDLRSRSSCFSLGGDGLFLLFIPFVFWFRGAFCFSTHSSFLTRRVDKE